MHYTYLYLRENGLPYYVGKGTKRRAFAKHHGRIFVPDKNRIIIQEFDSEEDALFAEKFLINFYGRKDIGGILLNLVDGGIGGWNPSEDVRHKMRMAKLGKPHKNPVTTNIKKGQHISVNTEFKKGCIPWNKGKSSGTGNNNPFFGKKHTEESKAKMRLAKCRFWKKENR
jgi:hypothetical protein